MILQRFYLECLSHASYLIGDKTTGRAVLVDPRRDITDYLAEARDQGLRIEGVINTHVHADFVGGHVALAQQLGAWIGYGAGARTEFPVRELHHEELLSLGQVELQILATPGHTWESISVAVREAPNTEWTAVLTGDCLFVGDVGRPDLVTEAGGSSQDLARAMYRSLHEVLMRLPETTRVMPAHGAGSSCGKNLSPELESTIGEQRAFNPMLLIEDEDDFVAELTAGQPEAPQYFATSARLNRSAEAGPIEPAHVASVGLKDLPRMLTADITVLDTREADAYAVTHLPGAINIGLDGRFAETVGMMLTPTQPVVVVAHPDRHIETLTRLARVGFDQVLGWLDATELTSTTQDIVISVPRLAPDALDTACSDPITTVLDVRSPGEYALGSLPGALNIPLVGLVRRLEEIPEHGRVVVHCAGGWRSSVAASMIRARRNPDTIDVRGGYTAWQQLQSPASTKA